MDNPDRLYRTATPDEIELVDAALEKCNGNRVLAAAALGWDAQRVQNLVICSPRLNAKWVNPRTPKNVEPGEVTDMHRERGLKPKTIPEQQEALVEAVSKQDALLHKGWSKLGFNSKERKFLAGLQNTYARNFAATLDLAAGGSAHANTRLLLVLENLTEKIGDIREHPENYRLYTVTKAGDQVLVKSEHDYEREFHALLVQVSAELRKMGESAMKANELRLKVEKLRAAQQAQGPKKVAGWDAATPVETKTVTP